MTVMIEGLFLNLSSLSSKLLKKRRKLNEKFFSAVFSAKMKIKIQNVKTHALTPQKNMMRGKAHEAFPSDNLRKVLAYIQSEANQSPSIESQPR